MFGKIIGAAGSLLGGIMGNDASAKQASNAQQHSDKQLQNRHQWEANDLRAAGRNPILYSGSSPSTGSSAMASMQNPAAGLSNLISNDAADTSADASAKQVKLNEEKLKTELDLLKSQTVQAQTQGVKNLADAKFAGNKGDISKPLANLAHSAHKVTKEIGKDVNQLTSGSYNSAKSAGKWWWDSISKPFRPSTWKGN